VLTGYDRAQVDFQGGRAAVPCGVRGRVPSPAAGSLAASTVGDDRARDTTPPPDARSRSLAGSGKADTAPYPRQIRIPLSVEERGHRSLRCAAAASRSGSARASARAPAGLDDARSVEASRCAVWARAARGRPPRPPSDSSGAWPVRLGRAGKASGSGPRRGAAAVHGHAVGVRLERLETHADLDVGYWRVSGSTHNNGKPLASLFTTIALP
jgi:hypothetical protein